MRKPVTDRACSDSQCAMFGKIGKGNIILHGFLKLKRGRRRRYRCEACDGTFVSSLGTPYHRLKCTRAHFDKVAALYVFHQRAWRGHNPQLGLSPATQL